MTYLVDNNWSHNYPLNPLMNQIEKSRPARPKKGQTQRSSVSYQTRLSKGQLLEKRHRIMKERKSDLSLGSSICHWWFSGASCKLPESDIMVDIGKSFRLPLNHSVFKITWKVSFCNIAKIFDVLGSSTVMSWYLQWFVIMQNFNQRFSTLV